MNCSKCLQDSVSLLCFPKDQASPENLTRTDQIPHSLLTSDCFKEHDRAARFGIEKRVSQMPCQLCSLVTSTAPLATNTGEQYSSRKRSGKEVSIPVEKNGV